MNPERDGFQGQRQGFSPSQQSNRQNSQADREEQDEGGYQGGAGRGSARSGDFFPVQTEVINLSGEVITVTPDFLQVRDSSGSDIMIENRAWWYAQEQGFFANVGDQLELVGFYDDHGVLEVSWIANRTLSSEVQIRDDGDRPYWAGGNGGRGGQGGRAG